MDAPHQNWAEAVLETLDTPKPDPVESLARMRRSPFASDAAARTMERIYAECVD